MSTTILISMTGVNERKSIRTPENTECKIFCEGSFVEEEKVR